MNKTVMVKWWHVLIVVYKPNYMYQHISPLQMQITQHMQICTDMHPALVTICESSWQCVRVTHDRHKPHSVLNFNKIGNLSGWYNNTIYLESSTYKLY